MISISCASSTRTQPAYLYCLATTFQDWGATRQSILSAARVITLADAPIEETPAFLRHLAYPTYFSNLVEMEAQERALDPAADLLGHSAGEPLPEPGQLLGLGARADASHSRYGANG